jgi:UDP-N-acetylglucosamine acyltransferase
MRLFSKFIKERNTIHPTAIIEDGVEIGEGNYIGPYCIIYNGTVIGDNNRFESHCVIGSLPEHKEYFNGGSSFGVKIGNNNTIREFTTINAGCTQNTIMGNNNIMLRGSHFSHDSIMENNCTLSCNVAVGGYSYLMEGCNMALNSVCHQHSVIGAYSMVGMSGVVTKSSAVIPGFIYVGNPIKHLKENTIGLQRAGITEEQLEILRKDYNILCRKY